MNNLKTIPNTQTEGVDRPEPAGTKPLPPYKWTPEPKYDMTVGADGLPVSTLAKQSPFPLALIRLMRGNSTVMSQLERGRPQDLLEHRRIMIEEIGPALERKHSVSARSIFLQGHDGNEALRLHSASRDDYDMLREYSRYLKR